MTNTTLVYSDPKELDYLLYWGTVYHSSLPYFQQQAAFLRDTMKVEAWQVRMGGGFLEKCLVPCT